jgi:hypothetical protein
MHDTLLVGLASWIINDGNYGDFRRGDRASFALEVNAPTTLSLADAKSEQTPSLENAEGNLYRVLGKVTHVFSDWWVINAGLLFYRQRKPPPNIELGYWVKGEVQVGVDPFDYSQRLSRRPDVPALIYDWEIKKVEIQTAPYIEVSPRTMVRDPSRRGWREIDQTRAAQDDGGLAEYLLHCERLDNPPRR